MIINAVIKASSRQVFSEEVCFAILDFNKNQALSHSGEHLCCAVRLLQMPRKQSSGLCYQFIHNSKFIHTHTSPLCTSKPGSDKNLFHTFPLQLHWKQWIFAQSGLGVLYVLITFTSMPTPTVFINRKSSNFGLENVKDCPLESLAVLSLNNRTICAGNAHWTAMTLWWCTLAAVIIMEVLSVAWPLGLTRSLWASSKCVTILYNCVTYVWGKYNDFTSDIPGTFVVRYLILLLNRVFNYSVK